MNTIHDLDRALRELEQRAPDPREMHQRVTRQLATRPQAARTAWFAISAAAAVVIAIAALTIALAWAGGRAHRIAPDNNGSPVPAVRTSPTPAPASSRPIPPR